LGIINLTIGRVVVAKGRVSKGWDSNGHCAFLCRVLQIPILGRFMWPFAVARLRLRYFAMPMAIRLGHLLRYPQRMAFKSVEILGLHKVCKLDAVGFIPHCVHEQRNVIGALRMGVGKIRGSQQSHGRVAMMGGRARSAQGEGP
jgi:hypothetical protein